MKSETRVYRADVLGADGAVTGSRLIETTHPDRASAHVARDLIRVRVATQKDLLQMRDVEVECPEARPTKKIGTIRVAFTIPKTAPAEIRAAGEAYLREAGERATEEGLKGAMRLGVQTRLTDPEEPVT